MYSLLLDWFYGSNIPWRSPRKNRRKEIRGVNLALLLRVQYLVGDDPPPLATHKGDSYSQGKGSTCRYTDSYYSGTVGGGCYMIFGRGGIDVGIDGGNDVGREGGREVEGRERGRKGWRKGEGREGEGRDGGKKGGNAGGAWER